MADTHGPYHRLYASIPSVWEGHVGEMVRRLVERLLPPEDERGRALDLGAGEGDNGIYLATHCFQVEMVEISPAAAAHYRERERALPPEVRARLLYRCEPVGLRSASPVHRVVIAYGLLHCFRTPAQAEAAASYCMASMEPGGYLALSCLTDGVPPHLAAHPELAACFLPGAERVRGWLASLDEVHTEMEWIDESHGAGPPHRHEVFRGIFRRPESSPA